MNKLIADLHDVAADDAARFGPKSANQAKLAGAGLPVPAGFCLDAEAYRVQLQELGLKESASEIKRLDETQQRQRISEIRIALFDSAIVPEIADPLLAAWNKLICRSGAKVAVRSSALSEDLAESSFAGQYESFLGIGNEEDFLTAVRACWAAIWSPRVLRYMRDNDMNPADTAMALCIQELIEARVSGGGLSRLADGNMMLSASRGLGTAIAQGEVVPDRYSLTSNGIVLETETGVEEHNIGCDLHAAPQNLKRESEKGFSGPCLSGSQAEELGFLMIQTEKLMGIPVEIEWAMDREGFRLVQARPLKIEAAPVEGEAWQSFPGLRGHPSGTGWGAGRAVVVNCECELSRVGPGDVLVTRIASPALNHILPKVSAVVAERGGSTSHLASLARERNIPMVLGVLEATRKIPDGAQVGVDGVLGMVHWQQ